VSVQSSKYLLAIMLTAVLGPAPARMFGQAAAPASAEPQKNWKDRAEYDLYDSITKDTNPKTRLEKLQQWEKQYPMTEWIDARRTLLLTTYAGLSDAKNAVDEAKQILAANPKDFTALYYTMLFTIGLYSQNQSADVLDQGEKAAQAILGSLDTPPPGVAADAWAKLRPDLELLANRNLGWIAMQRKSWDAAEAQFQKTLVLSPNDAQVDYWMGTVIVQQKKVEKVPVAMFYFARAATYTTPPLALPADMQKTSLTYVQKLYKNYHGSDEGFNDVLTAAKSNTAPPAGFAIKNANEIAQAAAANEDEYNKAHPSEALWKNLKMTLTGSDGANYFMMMKGTEVPTLKGKVIKLEPAVKPKTILLAMEDSSNNTTTADATLKFEMALPGKVEEGTELTFEGVADSYTANPFMVVFNVDAEKLHGWTGKNAAPAPVHHRKPPA
jgi:hypothetical protein